MRPTDPPTFPRPADAPAGDQDAVSPLALLPTGVVDLLPSEAEAEAVTVGRLMKVFVSHGYDRVKPPLVEFADNLLAGAGAATADQTFRVLDPDTHRMLGLRADMTPQVARIASTRLASYPRPLRLSYAGECLRLRGTMVDPDRQVAQAGFELIGPDSPAADAEMVLLAAESLAAVGVERLSFDLSIPTLAPAILDEAGIDGSARAALTRALDRKDAAGIARHGGGAAALLTGLLLAAGPVEAAMEVLAAAAIGPRAAAIRARLAETVGLIRARGPALRLTLDPLEFRGFRYHTGLCLNAFAIGGAEELGRGGRYLSHGNEAATGFTLFPDAILRNCPKPPARQRAFLPCGTAEAEATALRAAGFATVAALADDPDPDSEARRLGCSHILRDGQAAVLNPE